MNKPVKQKLCWNCEGSVARTLENCPYCGVYLNPEEEAEIAETEALKAPYVPRATPEESIPEAPYVQPVAKQAVLPAENLEKSVPSPLKAALPLTLLMSGALSFLFAFLLFFFASDGKLTLQWDADYWPFYAIIAVPLLLAGWKTLDSLPE